MKRVVGCIPGKLKASERKAQEKAVSEYCTANDMLITEWLECESGKFGEIAYGAWLNGRKVDAVVVADSNVVSGNIYEFYAYRCALRRRHSDLVAVKDQFAGYALHRKLFDELVETICRIDLENAPILKPHDRTDKAARGAYIGGRAPMGYKVQDGKLVINPEEVPVVLCVMDRKRTGKTMLSTVDALNDGGYKTRNGGKFVISTVQSIWHNEMFYKGYYRIGKDGEWVKGQHEAILKD